MSSKNQQTLGDRVRKLREQRGWSQQKLAAMIPGVLQQSIDHLERGLVARPRYLPQLAVVLGAREEWLRTGKGAMSVSKSERPAFLDDLLLREVVIGVEKALAARKRRMEPEEKAVLIIAVCEIIADDEEEFSSARVTQAIENIILYKTVVGRSRK